MSDRQDFLNRGWNKFGYDNVLASWVASIKPAALAVTRDPAFSQWFRHRDTWFVGVNAIPNNETGSLNGGPSLGGAAIGLATEIYGDIGLDPAQVSVIYPGYPAQDADESDAAHRFRLKRDAAHVDGIKRVGPDQHRFLDEFHAYILGIPLSNTPDAPLVVWDKSHLVIGDAIRDALGRVGPNAWSTVDFTDVYQSARRQVFETCERIELPAKEGEATLVHRFTVHGVAPWENAGSQHRARPIIYFRPSFSFGSDAYLRLP